MIKIAVVGGVDCGKSTFVGRLLNIYNPLIYNKNVEEGTEFKNTDTLRDEVEKFITAVSSRYYLNDDICIINCPGHYKYRIDTLGCMMESDYIIHIVDKIYDSKSDFEKDRAVYFLVKNYINLDNSKIILLYNNKTLDMKRNIDIFDLNIVKCFDNSLVSIIEEIDKCVIDVNKVKSYFKIDKI